ncbi:MAB_1171c family putative transporter [Streptomyces sp. NPDC014894]|uniref:MAB_1171c family putative transporter n=1 Tax=unclassified Streptomyces TaxID=2593676 RepID=UPI0036FED874
MTSGSSDFGYYACGFALFLVCALKLPALIRRPHDTLLRTVCLLLFIGGWTMIFGAPDAIAALNRFTGVTNAAAPVVYGMTTAFGGVSLLLIVNWRSGPPEQTRRASRRCVAAYSLATLAIFVLFWAGDAPVEEVALFDVVYANTPYIREMILTYLIAQGVAMMTTCTLCWRWSREVHGSLRAGLRILAPAYLAIVFYDILRLTAVTARWTGHDLDHLIPLSVQFAAYSSVLGSVGFALPLAGPRVAQTARAVRQLRQLTPLWRALQQVPTPGAIRTSLPWWRTSPAVALTGRKTALYDAIHALTPYCDPAVRDAAHRAALRDGHDEHSASVAADAAMILAARARQLGAPDDRRTAAPASAWRSKDLVPLSLALASPVVRDHEHYLAPAESSPS